MNTIVPATRPYYKAALILFVLCLLCIMVGAGFWKFAMDASWRSNVNLNHEIYVPKGMSSYDYAMQQEALSNRYALSAVGAGIIAVATFSAGLTCAVISRHERLRPKTFR